jgi:hypothetical protein
MMIYGRPIRNGFLKIIAIIFFIVIAITLMSCDKLEFDPTTTTLKYILKEKKNEQPIK